MGDYGFIPFTTPISDEDREFAQEQFGGYDLTVGSGQYSDRRLCTKPTELNLASITSPLREHNMTQYRAEVGTYVINYYVHDVNGLGHDDCSSSLVRRTVTVKDTLAPVVTLKYKNKILTGVDHSVEHDINPAYQRVGEYTGHTISYHHTNPWRTHSPNGQPPDGTQFTPPSSYTYTNHYGNPQLTLMAEAAATMAGSLLPLLLALLVSLSSAFRS